MTPCDGPAAERPVAERTVAERPVAERPVAEGPVAEGPVAEGPTAPPLDGARSGLRVAGFDGGQVAGLLRAAAAVAADPRLWRTAARQVALLARPGWWRTRPHLPVPDPAYLQFRLHTAYGRGDQAPDPADVVAWLRWCARMGAIAPPP